LNNDTLYFVSENPSFSSRSMSFPSMTRFMKCCTLLKKLANSAESNSRAKMTLLFGSSKLILCFLIYIARCIEQTLDLYLLGIADEKGNKPELLPLKELTNGTPYSAEYLSLLARKGMLDAVREGKIWKSTRKSIQVYIEQHGRK